MERRVSLIISQIEISVKVEKHLAYGMRNSPVHQKYTYSYEFFVPSHSSCMQGGFPLEVGPITNMRISIIVELRHPESSACRVMVGRSGSERACGRGRFPIGQSNQNRVVFRILGRRVGHRRVKRTQGRTLLSSSSSCPSLSRYWKVSSCP